LDTNKINNTEKEVGLTKLSEAGEFKNLSAVEYATIRIAIPRGYLPTNLKIDHWGPDDEMVKCLYPSPSGRLSWKELYLDDDDLAYQFREYLHEIFESRKYCDNYTLNVEIKTSTSTKTVTKLKLKHSAQVRDTLTLAGTN
jgi:hypothetical protein